MKISKLFKILCLFPILVGCNQTLVPEKEQLIVATYYFDDSNPMEEEYANKIKESKLVIHYNFARYDVTPNEFRGLFSLYAAKEHEYPDVILYKGELLPFINLTTPGYGTLAYYKGNGKELIYHTTVTGSMFTHVYINAYDLKTKQEMVANIQHKRPEYLTSDDYRDIVFKTSVKDDKFQLQAYKLELEPFDSENPAPAQFKQTDLLYEDVLQYELVPWEEYSFYYD